MKELLIAFMVLISQHTGYAVPDHVPVIKHGSVCDIGTIIHGGVKQEDCETANYIGTYRIGTGEIWFVDRVFDKIESGGLENDIETKTVILHELTHFVQEANGYRPGMTWCDVEKEAYGMEFEYLKTFGYNPYQAMMIMHVNKKLLNEVTCGQIDVDKME